MAQPVPTQNVVIGNIHSIVSNSQSKHVIKHFTWGAKKKTNKNKYKQKQIQTKTNTNKYKQKQIQTKTNTNKKQIQTKTNTNKNKQ